MKLLVYEHFLNVRTSKQCGKKLAVGREPPGGRSPIQPAQWLIQPGNGTD